MNEDITLITLRIRKLGEKEKGSDGHNEDDPGSDLVLQLIDTPTGEVLEHANIPQDLKLPGHTGDYRTYRETFIKGTGEKSQFSDIGRHLFALLRLGKVGGKWDELKKNRKNQNESLRVLLDIEALIEEHDLALLPWELAFDGGMWRPFQNIKDTIVRIHKYNAEETNPKVEPANWPIRLLIVVGVKEDAIAASAEVAKIEDVLHEVNRQIDIELLEEKTIEDLEKKCKEFRPHIFHYIGHGGVEDNNSFIFLKDDAGNNDPWSASQIETSLDAWGWVPRFAFINACRTAGSKVATLDDQIVAWGIGDAFRSLGVPAVLTMQADVKGTMAGELAGVIYECLARGQSIDKAVASARIKVRNSLTGMKDDWRDWATPTLTVSIPPENVLPLRLTTKEREVEISRCEKFQEVSVLANRRDDRRKFIHGFYPISSKMPDKDLIVVSGSKDSGKTWMTLWCLEACARQNHDVRYIEVMGTNSPKWLDVLTQIQRGDKSKAVADEYPLIFRPLDEKAFSEFNHDLTHRIKNETPPDWDGSHVPFKELKKEDLENLDNLPENRVKEIFRSFRKALIQAAEINNPLIIVLDQFSSKDGKVSTTHMKDFLLPHLFEYAATGKLKSTSPEGTRSVKLVLLLNDDELRPGGIYEELNKKLSAYWHYVPLGGIPATDFDKVVKEFFRNLKVAPREEIRQLMKNISEKEEQYWIEKFAGSAKPVWKPILLGRLLESIKYVEQCVQM